MNNEIEKKAQEVFESAMQKINQEDFKGAFEDVSQQISQATDLLLISKLNGILERVLGEINKIQEARKAEANKSNKGSSNNQNNDTIANQNSAVTPSLKELPNMQEKAVVAIKNIALKIATKFFNEQGEEVLAKTDEARINAAKKSPIIQVENEADVKELQNGVNDLYERLAILGLKVKKQTLNNEKGAAVFYGVYLPRGLENNDIFSMNEEQILDAVKKQQEETQPINSDNFFTQIFGNLEREELQKLHSKQKGNFASELGLPSEKTSPVNNKPMFDSKSIASDLGI